MKKTSLWIALSLASRIGSKTLNRLFSHFEDDPQAILSASSDDLQAIRGIGPKTALAIRSVDVEETLARLSVWEASGVRVMPYCDAESGYPARLRQIEDPPPLLFGLGRWNPAFDLTISVVGTRQPSAEAAALARPLVEKLAEAGFVIVSGMARGVDTLAHEAALRRWCFTVAVLGSGVLRPYPPENQALIDWRSGEGMLLSEVAPDVETSRARLVARNRIISGLGGALVMIESAVDGGAMYAARFAREQGRPVLVLDLDASGNRALLDNGAQCLKKDLSNLELLLKELNHA